jgi:hypothetical protein
MSENSERESSTVSTLGSLLEISPSKGNTMTFRISGLAAKPFEHLYGLPEHVLTALGVQRHVADKKPGYPDRIELRDAEPGERLLLLNYEHLPANNPYRSRHAIFVIEGAQTTYDRMDEIPALLRTRTLSLRAFDNKDSMLDADLIDGKEVETLIERLFANTDVTYIHVHYAKRGCYAARIDRC